MFYFTCNHGLTHINTRSQGRTFLFHKQQHQCTEEKHGKIILLKAKFTYIHVHKLRYNSGRAELELAMFTVENFQILKFAQQTHFSLN